MIHQRFSEISVKFPRARFVCGSGPCEMSRISHTIHGTGIFTYIWLIFMVNVGKYTIRGSYGYVYRLKPPSLLPLSLNNTLNFRFFFHHQPTFKLKKLSLSYRKKRTQRHPPFSAMKIPSCVRFSDVGNPGGRDKTKHNLLSHVLRSLTLT